MVMTSLSQIAGSLAGAVLVRLLFRNMLNFKPRVEGVKGHWDLKKNSVKCNA